MIEAQITVCHPCDLPDLGLEGLKRGQEIWVSDAQARSSKDVQREQAKGNIRVNRKSRRPNQNPRRPAPPFVAHSRPQSHKGTKEPDQKIIEKTIEKTIVQEVDTEKLKAELLGDLLPGLRSAIAEEVGKVASQAPPEAPQAAPAPAASLDPAQLEGVLESVLRRVGLPTGGAVSPEGRTRKSSGPEEPVFIPDKIVAKDRKAKIDVKQKASEGGEELDDAQAALRALRGKKRGRKNRNEENKS